MKVVTCIGLLFCFCLSMTFALVTHTEAEEYYTYRDARGNLVISNKQPPPGSDVLKKQALPATVGPQVSQPPLGTDPQPNGRLESTPQPQNSK